MTKKVRKPLNPKPYESWESRKSASRAHPQSSGRAESFALVGANQLQPIFPKHLVAAIIVVVIVIVIVIVIVRVIVIAIIIMVRVRVMVTVRARVMDH